MRFRLAAGAFVFSAFTAIAVQTRPALASTTTPTAPSQEITDWCKRVQDSVRLFRWKIDACKDIDWKVGGHSANGLPLVYAEFGDPKSSNRTLVFTMVHGDEITPLYTGLELAHWLKDHDKALQARKGGTYVVLAPLVNPDGFFRSPRWRMNGHGVDVNRNFATSDWDARALKAWKTKYRSDPRRYPGPAARSEPETIFQENMIREVQPLKIISVHSPLNYLDYDGPSALSLDRFPRDYVHECLTLRRSVRAISSGFFPGSLGNYAGHQLGIPTLTLELPTANPRMALVYWKRYNRGIRTAIEFVMQAPENKTGSHAPKGM